MHLLKGTDSGLRRCVQAKLTSIISDSKKQRLGRGLYVDSSLELPPFESIKVANEWDWEQDPFSNRSWQWRLNWFPFVSYLIAYHSETNNDEVLNFALDSILSWIKSYIETDIDYGFEFIWHDHATALRAEQFVFFIYYVMDKANGWAKARYDEIELIKDALLVHGDKLYNDSFYSEHTNHGLEQARILLLLGTAFSKNDWKEKSITRIDSELEFSFTSEGVHKENSPAYHVFVLKVFKDIIEDYPSEILGQLSGKFDGISIKAMNFISKILRPDGLLPPIGDTEQLPTSDAYYNMFGDRIEYQYLLYTLSQGRNGSKPFKVNDVYPLSGYAIFRDIWPNEKNYRNAFHIITKVGCSSRYHHQQDEGHISVYAGGEDWLIDSGLYNYNNNDPVRKYIRSRNAHNIPLISHVSYSSNFDHRLSSWKVKEFSEDEINPFIDIELSVLEPIIQKRKVSFNSILKEIRVRDVISSSDNFPRTVTFQWHIPDDKQVSVKDNVITVIGANGNEMKISFIDEFVDNIYLNSGIENDRVFSVISKKSGEFESSQVLRVVFKERCFLDVTTFFSFNFPYQYDFENINKLALQKCPPQFYLNEKKDVVKTVFLGLGASYKEFSSLHRKNGFGHVVMLLNESTLNSMHVAKIQQSLSESYLTTWLKLYTFSFGFDNVPILSHSLLLDLEFSGRLVITKNGIEENCSKVLCLILELLIKKLNKGSHVLISSKFDEELLFFCLNLCDKYDLTVYVSDYLE